MDKLLLTKIVVRLAAVVSLVFILHSIFFESKFILSSSKIIELVMIVVWVHAEWDWSKRKKKEKQED